MGQIGKIVSFSKRGSLIENNGTITNVQLLMVMEIYNFFKNFYYLLIGNHGEKLKKISQLGRSAFFKGSISIYKANGMYTGQHLFPSPKIWNFVTGMGFTDEIEFPQTFVQGD